MIHLQSIIIWQKWKLKQLLINKYFSIAHINIVSGNIKAVEIAALPTTLGPAEPTVMVKIKKKSECEIMIDEKINKQGDLQRRMLEAAEE